MQFSGGQPDNAPVRVTWKASSKVKVGTKVWVTVWRASSCAKAPRSWDRRVQVNPGRGTWKDPRYGKGAWCYRAEIVNRYGAGRPASVKKMDRWAPVPEAPDVGNPVWVPAEGSFRVSWRPPNAATHLEVVRPFDDPTTCPTSYQDGYAEPLYEETPGRWLVSASAAQECVLFVAVASWGSVSPGTEAVLQVPAPTVSPTVGSVTVDELYGSATVPARLSGNQYQLGVEVLPGPCPAEPPADIGWWDGYENRPGVWTVYPESEGLQCVLFAALDWFGQHGPLVTRTFTLP